MVTMVVPALVIRPFPVFSNGKSKLRVVPPSSCCSKCIGDVMRGGTIGVVEKSNNVNEEFVNAKSIVPEGISPRAENPKRTRARDRMEIRETRVKTFNINRAMGCTGWLRMSIPFRFVKKFHFAGDAAEFTECFVVRGGTILSF